VPSDVGLGQNGTCLHAGRDQAVVGDAKTNDLIGFLRGLSVVAATYLVDRGDVVGHVVVELRGAVADRGFFVDHGRKDFIVDVDQFDGIVRHGLGFGDHQCDAFADESEPGQWQRRACPVPSSPV
jgi:hypothetical protein